MIFSRFEEDSIFVFMRFIVWRDRFMKSMIRRLRDMFGCIV